MIPKSLVSHSAHASKSIEVRSSPIAIMRPVVPGPSSLSSRPDGLSSLAVTTCRVPAVTTFCYFCPAQWNDEGPDGVGQRPGFGSGGFLEGAAPTE